MSRDANFLVHQPDPIVITIDDAADRIMAADSDRQAAFFASMASKLKDNDWPPFGWSMQCRAIASAMTDDECRAVREMLATLVEHLESISVERKAAALAAGVVDAVESLTGGEVSRG